MGHRWYALVGWVVACVLVIGTIGLWAAIGVLVLFGRTLPEALEIAAAIVTGLGAVALFPLMWMASQRTWGLDRRRVWRALGDLSAVGMLGLALVAAGFVIAKGLKLVGGSTDTGVADGELVAVMVFVGAFGLLAILLIARRSPAPTAEEVALGDVLSHAALARKAAGEAETQRALVDKALAGEVADFPAAASVVKRGADCVRITARCAGLTASQLMASSTDVEFARIVEILEGEARLGFDAYSTAAGIAADADARLRVLSSDESRERDRLKTRRARKRRLELAERQATASLTRAERAVEEAADDATEAFLETIREISEQVLGENDASGDELLAQLAELGSAKVTTRKRLQAAGERAVELARIRGRIQLTQSEIDDIDGLVVAIAGERDGIGEELRQAAAMCTATAGSVATTIEWAADEAYVTTETGLPPATPPTPDTTETESSEGGEPDDESGEP